MTAVAGIHKVCADLVQHLQDNGLTASLDGAQVEWPGVWVWPGPIAPELLDGNGTMSVVLNLGVPNTEASTALLLLDELLGQVLDLVDPEGDVSPQLVQPPGSNPIPGLQLTILRPYERTETP